MFKSGTFWLFYLSLCLVWRIMFACLVMCRWQVRIWDILVVLPFSLSRLENHVCLSRDVSVAGAA
jgi:hypothetical protein